MRAENPVLNAKTVSSAKAAPGKRLTLNDGGVPGLHLRVSGDTGEKVWTHRYYWNGNERRRRIGTFPGMKLSEARGEVRRRNTLVDAGQDPERKCQDRAGEDRSFKALAEFILEVKAKVTRPRTQKLRRDGVDRYLLPVWGSRPANGVTRADVIELVEGIRDDGKGITANRIRSLVSVIYNEGLYREWGGASYLVINPVHGTKPPVKREPTRDRFLTREEIAKLWVTLEGEGVLTEGLGKLALLSGQRIGQVLRMRWDLIEEDVWTTPPEDHKSNRMIKTPLSKEAIAVLGGLRRVATDEKWVFPARQGSKRPHITNVSSTTLQRLREKSGCQEPWTWHDLRRTMRLWMVAAPTDRRTPGLGIEPHVADACLTHAEDSLGFSRYQADSQKCWYLFEDKRFALEAWGAFVMEGVMECASTEEEATANTAGPEAAA